MSPSNLRYIHAAYMNLKTWNLLLFQFRQFRSHHPSSNLKCASQINTFLFNPKIPHYSLICCFSLFCPDLISNVVIELSLCKPEGILQREPTVIAITTGNGRKVTCPRANTKSLIYFSFYYFCAYGLQAEISLYWALFSKLNSPSTALCSFRTHPRKLTSV